MGRLALGCCFAFLVVWAALNASCVFSQTEDESATETMNNESTQAAETSQKLQESPASFSPYLSKLSKAKDSLEALTACEDALRQCKRYDDYDRLASELKNLSTSKANASYLDVLYYAIAKVRSDELAYLAEQNDIDSGRIYMSVSEGYYAEALDYLDKAAAITKSKDLGLDIYFLRFLIFKELFQPEKGEAIFNEILNRISTYSDNPSTNMDQLIRVSNAFSARGLSEYALKLKTAYASKGTSEDAKEIAQDILNGANGYFDSGDLKNASATYDVYLDLAQDLDKDTTAAKTMEIAEKYFNGGHYKEAVKYYTLYLNRYKDSPVADYASYRLALSAYNDKDYIRAIAKFEEFLKTYQNSVWFEKAFESLLRLYYENFAYDNAIASLQKLIDDYPRRDVRDYAEFLIGLLNYSAKDYDSALARFKKVQDGFVSSVYYYAAGRLIDDIASIKNGNPPSFTTVSTDTYKVWEPEIALDVVLTPVGVEDANAVKTALEKIGVAKPETVDVQNQKQDEIRLKVKPGSKVTFTLELLKDFDLFGEYLQDKEDLSRLPRKIREAKEEDLLSIAWSSTEGGKFIDEKQTKTKVWLSPKEPGTYKISVIVDDMGLIRSPDKGVRKDTTSKTLIAYITVE